MNRCLGWVQLTQKKWKNHFCYHVIIFNHSLFLEKKTSSVYDCSLKNVQLLVWFLSFPNFAFIKNNDFAFNIINEKTTDAKKALLKKALKLLLVWFLSFPNFAFKRINNGFAFNIINGKKQQKQKKGF